MSAPRPKVTEVTNQDGVVLAVGDRVRSIPETFWPGNLAPIRTGVIRRIGYMYVTVWGDHGGTLRYGVYQDDDGVWRTNRLERVTA